MKTGMSNVDGIGIYTALPTQRDTGSAILLVHEWWGLVEHVKGWADHFAGLGYRAVAVDLFDGKSTKDAGEAARLMEGADRKECLRKLGVVIDWAKSRQGLEARKLGTIGWCFGGGLSLQCALGFGAKVDASVIYYGLVETDPAKLKGCRVPLLGVFAKKDGWITLDSVKKFEEACRKAGVALENHLYDADHAFATPMNKQYDAKLTKDAEQKVAAFLGRTLA